MELRIFFFNFFPIAEEEDVYKEIFGLTYYSSGSFSRQDVLDMSFNEREHYKRELKKELEAEANAWKRNPFGASMSRLSKRKRR